MRGSSRNGLMACRKPHGRDDWADQVIKLVIHDKRPYPHGKYLIKGGGPRVWKLDRLRKKHRCSQGVIHGKRCGTTENIGPAARRVLRSRASHPTANEPYYFVGQSPASHTFVYVLNPQHTDPRSWAHEQTFGMAL
jgi:hypothetical protein